MASERERPAAEGQGEEDDPFYLRHPRMPMSERAKIFVPFEPLEGFRAELAKREREVEGQVLEGEFASREGGDWKG